MFKIKISDLGRRPERDVRPMIELGSFTPDLLKRKEIVQEVRKLFLKERKLSRRSESSS